VRAKHPSGRVSLQLEKLEEPGSRLGPCAAVIDTSRGPQIDYAASLPIIAVGRIGMGARKQYNQPRVSDVRQKVAYVNGNGVAWLLSDAGVPRLVLL